MEVVFRTNLGSREAVELGLDHTECLVGAKVSVSETTCDVLIARGLVEPVAKSPKKVKAVPPAAKVRGVEEGEKYKERETKKE